MTIQELFKTNKACTTTLKEIDRLFLRMPNMKSFDWVVEFRDVDDNFKYVHTAPSFKTLFCILKWRIKRVFWEINPFK